MARSHDTRPAISLLQARQSGFMHTSGQTDEIMCQIDFHVMVRHPWSYVIVWSLPCIHLFQQLHHAYIL